MSGKNKNSARFAGKKAAAIAALLSCPTLEAASQVAHVPTSTLRRWRARPEFAQQILVCQQEILQGAVNELRMAGLDAATALRRIAKDPASPIPARVRACGLILTLLLRNHENEVLEFRMSRIEAALQRRKGPSH